VRNANLRALASDYDFMTSREYMGRMVAIWQGIF
jgi:hypothetical protein